MKEYKQIVGKFRRKLVFEGLLRSFLWSLPIGCGVMLVLDAVLFLTGTNRLDLLFAAGFGVTVLGVIIWYFAKYRPTEKDVARRVDLLGLKERVLTMVELKDDPSFMAQKQREDALLHIKRVQNTKIKLTVRKAAVSLSVVFLCLSVAATFVTALSLKGDLPSFEEIITPEEQIPTFNVSYMEEEGGYIEGEMFQVISRGDSTNEVVAVADDGYMFESWSDGVTTPNRTDKDINSNLEVFAIFIEIGEDEFEENVLDNDLPDKEQMDMGTIDGVPPHGAGAAGKYEEYNQVIDGSIYYRDVYKEYYDKAMEILNNGGTIPEYMRIIIEEYYTIIK